MNANGFLAIPLPPACKAWLVHQAAHAGVPVADIVERRILAAMWDAREGIPVIPDKERA